MKTYWLTLTLQSDGAFSRGDGVAGLLNAEVQHDASGLPYLGGKTLKGLLGATCGEIIFALRQNGALQVFDWQEPAQRLFGGPGSSDQDSADLHVGDALLPEDLRLAIAYDVERGRVTREEVLDSLTALRRQTAIDAETGAPRQETLRTIRVILRQTTFVARLDFLSGPRNGDLELLATCIKGLRRAGANRNRGLGRLILHLYEHRPDGDVEPITDDYFARFHQEVMPS